MTRKQLREIINRAHAAIHANNVDLAHEILHEGYSVEGTESMTGDPEVQEVVAKFQEYMNGTLSCGHTIGDLIGGEGEITKCGACVAARAKAKSETNPHWCVINLEPEDTEAGRILRIVCRTCNVVIAETRATRVETAPENWTAFSQKWLNDQGEMTKAHRIEAAAGKVSGRALVLMSAVVMDKKESEANNPS